MTTRLLHANGVGATPPAVPGSALAIRMLGYFDVWVAGGAMRPLRTRKGEWLLALLALRSGSAVDRAWLAGTLWPESVESQAFYNLRRSLTDLRHALGPEASRLLSPAPHTLALDLTGAAIDVVEYDAAIARGDPESLELAVDRYQGPLLQECREEWVVRERQDREEAYLQALEALAAGALARGEPAVAERYLQRAAAEDPLRDSTHRAWMQALAESGDYAAAVQVYREFRARLHRELSAAPGPETQALFQRLRAEARSRSTIAPNHVPDVRNDVPRPCSIPRAARHNLPAPFSRFVGREAEMAEVERLLGSSRLVTLTGCGGCGKTRLALETAADSVEEFADGVWLVDLAPVLDAARVSQAVATVLGIKADPGRPLVDTLLDFLHPRSALLLLDNCEHLLGACAQLADVLLHGCPELRILATSREALGLLGETIYQVPCLSLPPSVDGASLMVDGPTTPGSSSSSTINHQPSTLLQYEAVRLFVDRASAALLSFVLTEQNGPAVARVCRHLDGIPLAIELAAGRVRCLPVERIAQRLDDRFHLLTDGGRTALPRHRTLKGLIDWSYELLSEPERTLLRRLSIFVGGWTSEAAEAVCADSGFSILDSGLSSGPGPIQNPQSAIQNAEVTALLSALVEKSLVVFEEEDHEERYRFLETVRQYALDRLRESGEVVRFQERHRDWFLRLAEQAEAEHHGPKQSEWLKRLETEHDNLRAALDLSHSFAEGAEAELCLATALAWFWHTHNHWREGRQRLEGALARSENVSAPVRARGLVAAGYLACGERDDSRAQALCEEGLALFQELGDKRGAGWALYTLGLSTLRRDPARSAAYHEPALACFQEVGDAAGIALAVYEQGVTAYAQRDFTRAAALIKEGLAWLRAQGNTHFVADALGTLAYCRRQQGNLEDARVLTAESLAIFRELGDRWGMAWTARNLAHVLRGLGEWEEAQELYRESLSLCRETARPRDTAFVLMGLADIALQQGDIEAARGRYREGLTGVRNQGSDRDIPWLLEKFAGLAAARGHGQQAARLLGAAAALRELLGVPLPPADRSDYYERQLLTAHSLLSEDAFAAAWQEGRAMAPEQAIAEALAEAEAPPDAPVPSGATHPGTSCPRIV